MNLTIEQFSQQLKEYDIRCVGDGEGAVLEFLWKCYYNSKAVDDGWIRKAENAINPIFEELSMEASDSLFDLVDDLITAYQRAAFLEGIQVGFQLARELTAQ